jgi:hypothetical protein
MLKKSKYLKEDIFERKIIKKRVMLNRKIIPSNNIISESEIHDDSQFSAYQDEGIHRKNNIGGDINLKARLTQLFAGFKSAFGNLFTGGKEEVKFYDTSTVISRIVTEQHKLTKTMSKAWTEFGLLIRDFPTHLKRYHEAKYWRLYKQMLDEKRIIYLEVDELNEVLSDQRLKDLHNNLIAKRREYLTSLAYETSRGLPGEKDIFLQKSSPIFYEEHWIIDEEEDSESESSKHANALPSGSGTNGIIDDEPIHLVFFVHGFKGSHMDMHFLWNMLVLRCPKIQPIMCKSMQGKTDGQNYDLERLGEDLCEEVHQEIEELVEDDNFRISFVGHSLGGLVIRSAIRSLSMYKDKFQNLMTVGTPHWGYMHSKSRLLSLGIWIYDHTITNPVLQQLRLGDYKDPRETIIYELSWDASIGWFKDIVLWGSEQDSFASVETSLIQESTRMSGLKKYNAIVEMQNNIQ